MRGGRGGWDLQYIVKNPGLFSIGTFDFKRYPPIITKMNVLSLLILNNFVWHTQLDAWKVAFEWGDRVTFSTEARQNLTTLTYFSTFLNHFLYSQNLHLFQMLYLIIHQIISLAHDWSKRVAWPNIPQLKLGNIENILQFSKPHAWRKKQNSLHLDIFAPIGGYCLHIFKEK